MTTLLLLLTLAGAQPPAACEPQFAPLDTGTSSARSRLPHWWKSEAGGWDGDGWLGWTHEGDALVPVRMIVRDLPKLEEKDEEEEDEVTVESVPGVAYAVRCVRGPRTGPIRSAGVVNHELRHQGPLTITLGDRRYELRVQAAREDLGDARVVLSDGRRTQLLYAADGFADDPHFEVEWAGDLDGDGRLDLVVNLHRKYSWHPHRLLLSSHARWGQLVGEAAVFETGD